MASGSSSGGGNSGSKGFDFGSDDVLCSYDDYGNDGGNGTHTDSSIGANSNEDIQKSLMERMPVFPVTTYSAPNKSSSNQDVVLTVERTMKKYTDDLMRFLEGIGSRLSQLELYCYNLDKSIGEMHSNLVRDHDESETKLKSLEKYIKEVHRSVQIVRDKQELADTQKELAKLQLAQKESYSASNSQENEGRASPPSSEAKKSENSCDVHGQEQLALVPHQVVSQPARAVEHQTIAAPSSMSSQTISQAPAFYMPSQLTIQPVLSQSPQNQYLVAQSQFQDFFSRMTLLPMQSQLQDSSRVAPQQAQSQLNQSSQVQSLPPYQQPWPQLQQQPVQPSVQTVMQTNIRSPSQPIYSSYLPNQSNQSLAEMIPSSVPVQVSFDVASQPGSVGPEAIPYSYGAAGRPIQPHPSIQNLKAGFMSQSGDVYVPTGLPRPTLPPPGTPYMMFDGEVGWMHHPPPQPHYHQGAYPPTSTSLNLQRVPNASMVVPKWCHPYRELIEKVMSMGYRGDHVVGVIQRMEENGQPIDFNSVLDRLSGHSSGGSQGA